MNIQITQSIFHPPMVPGISARRAKSFWLEAFAIAIVAICMLAFVGCQKNEPAVAALASEKTAPQNDQVSNAVPSLSSQPASPTAEPASDKSDQQKGATQKKQVTTKKPAFLMTRNGRTYNRSQLHKNQTLLLYAFDPDIRADYTFYHVRNILTKEQFKICKELAISYEPEFQEIIRKRALVLETASDDDPELENKLLNLKMDTADVVQTIRGRIFREILTDDQRAIEKRKNKEFEAQQAIERAREEEEAREEDQKMEVQNTEDEDPGN